jgi:hypothetical protein
MLNKEIETVLETDKLYAWTYTIMDPKRWARDMLKHMIKRKILDEYITEHNIKRTGDEIFYYDALMGGKPEVSEMEVKALYDEKIGQGKEYDRPFEEIKYVLKDELRRKKRDEGFAKMLPKLMKKYEIVINEDYFKSDGEVDIYDNK